MIFAWHSLACEGINIHYIKGDTVPGDILFLFVLATALATLMAWAFRTLPRERWQMIAALPLGREPDGRWSGMNLTWYGFFSATAYAAAVTMLLVLSQAVGIRASAVLLLVVVVLAVCVPASRLVARIVEGKRHTFTVAGAFFVGLIITTPAILLINTICGPQWGLTLPVLPMLAAIAISYALGEGLGRLACLSFGCCYGRPLRKCPRWVRRVFQRVGTRFSGNTRKAAYEGHLENRLLFPAQALTAVVMTGIALAGTGLFLSGHYAAALILAVGLSQVWRLISEFLRADYRGGGKVSAYQIMAGLAVLYAIGLGWFLPAEVMSRVAMTRAVASLWHPALILFLQGLWLTIFLFTGRSEVTASTLTFRIRSERI